jgi:thiol-disulfide isomerase/thioredoxin
MKTIIVGFCILMTVFLQVACGQNAEPDTNNSGAGQATTSGREATLPKVVHFALTSALDGTIVDSNEYAGKVRLINFFATWCPPCKEEIPSLIELQKDYGPEGFSVIGLSVDQGDRQQVKAFARKMGINYPVLMADEAVIKGFGGVSGIPVSFLVGRDDVLLQRYFGFVDRELIEGDIKNALKENGEHVVLSGEP